MIHQEAPQEVRETASATNWQTLTADGAGKSGGGAPATARFNPGGGSTDNLRWSGEGSSAAAAPPQSGAAAEQGDNMRWAGEDAAAASEAPAPPASAPFTSAFSGGELTWGTDKHK